MSVTLAVQGKPSIKIQSCCALFAHVIIALSTKSLIDRMPKDLWVEGHNIVQDAVTKIIRKKKKCKKAKCSPEEALQIAEEKREVKGKGERERDTQLSLRE